MVPVGADARRADAYRMRYRSQNPLYRGWAAAAVIPSMPDVRVFADVPPANFMRAVCPNLGVAASRAAAPAYLALSGGGADGAYGAGVLNGWTELGTRPEFTIVSGVSTGALIAPFAFLGPAYDGVLQQYATKRVEGTYREQANP